MVFARNDPTPASLRFASANLRQRTFGGMLRDP